MRQVLSILLVMLNIAAAQAASGTIVGAIRWDLWYGGTGNGLASNVEVYVECSLGPSAWQFRAPWFAQVTGANTINIGATQGNKQSVLDLEIQAAHATGLQYWAFDWYPNSTGGPLASGYNNAWTLYQSSSYNNLIKWALLIGLPTDVPTWEGYNAQFITYMQQSNYLKVLGGRPVLFLNLSSSLTSAWAPAVADLKAKAVAAGLATPYVVVLLGQNNGSAATSTAATIGADAGSGYAIFDAGAFSALTAYAQNQWASYAYYAGVNGVGMVTNTMMGSDTRPRAECPTVHSGTAPWLNNSYFVTPGTNSDRVTQMQDAITFTLANPSANPSTLILTYSWDECDEGGGCLIPTIGDPPSSSPPYMNSIETALSAILP